MRRCLGWFAALLVLLLGSMFTPSPRPALATVVDGLQATLMALPPPGEGGVHRAVLNGRALRYRVQGQRQSAKEAIKEWERALPDIPSAWDEPQAQENLARTLARAPGVDAAQAQRAVEGWVRRNRRRSLALDLGSASVAARVRGPGESLEALALWKEALLSADPGLLGEARAAVAFDEGEGASLVEVWAEPGRFETEAPLLPGAGKAVVDFAQADATGAYRLSCTEDARPEADLRDDLRQQGWQAQDQGFHQRGDTRLFVHTQAVAGRFLHCAAALELP